jgi:hypothetical protein
MKVISLWQPWASLVVEDKKHFETRSWATSYRGPLGIHAAQRCPLDGLLKNMSRETRAMAFEALEFTGDTVNWQKEFPTGVILGYVELIDCIRITESYSAYVKKYMPKEYAFGDYTPGRWAWALSDPVKLPEPIPAKGMQRLWEYDVPMKEVFECRD